MIVEKGGREIGLKLQDLSLKILGVEIKFSSLCVRIVSIFPIFVCQIGQTGIVFIRSLVYNNSYFQSLDLRKPCNVCYWMFYA
jgi:hypothetical protein